MRVAIAGKNRAAVESMRWIVDNGGEALVIATRGDDGTDGWQPSLLAEAARLSVPTFQPERINEPAAVAEIVSFRPEILLSIQYDQIFGGEILSIPHVSPLNLHFALLPRHQGVAPLAWALLEGDREVGVTLHRMVRHIDAGAIIAQRAVPIRHDSTARELYDDVCELAIALVRDEYPFSPERLASARAQDVSDGCYHRAGDFDFSAVEIDWDRPVSDVHNWVRAMIFPPMQLPTTAIGGRQLQVRRVGAPIAGLSDVPGTIVEVGRGVGIAARGGVLPVLELCDPSDASLTTEDIVAQLHIGSNPA